MINENYERTMHDKWIPACTVITTYDRSPYMTQKHQIDFDLIDIRTQYAVLNRCAAIANWAILAAIESKKKP